MSAIRRHMDSWPAISYKLRRSPALSSRVTSSAHASPYLRFSLTWRSASSLVSSDQQSLLSLVDRAHHMRAFLVLSPTRTAIRVSGLQSGLLLRVDSAGLFPRSGKYNTGVLVILYLLGRQSIGWRLRLTLLGYRPTKSFTGTNPFGHEEPSRRAHSLLSYASHLVCRATCITFIVTRSV